MLIILFPGVFFIIPCVDIYEKIDMRTQTFDVPPQEVMMMKMVMIVMMVMRRLTCSPKPLTSRYKR